MVYKKYVSAFILGIRYLQRVFYCLNLYNRLYALPMEQATYSAVVPWMLSWIHWWVLSPTAFIKQSPVNGLDEDVSLSWLESPLCVCTRCYGWKYEFLVLSVHLYHVWDRIHQRHDPIQHTSGIFHQHLWTGLSDSVLLYRCCIRSNPYRFHDPALHELLGASEWRGWGWESVANVFEGFKKLFTDILSTLKIRTFRRHLGMYLFVFGAEWLFTAAFT